jgi:methylglutaconyl-CoA hydratase
LREEAVMAPGEARCEAAAQAIARLRATDEAREGLSAFLDKRTPAWRA